MKFWLFFLVLWYCTEASITCEHSRRSGKRIITKQGDKDRTSILFGPPQDKEGSEIYFSHPVTQAERPFVLLKAGSWEYIVFRRSDGSAASLAAGGLGYFYDVERVYILGTNESKNLKACGQLAKAYEAKLARGPVDPAALEKDFTDILVCNINYGYGTTPMTSNHNQQFETPRPEPQYSAHAIPTGEKRRQPADQDATSQPRKKQKTDANSTRPANHDQPAELSLQDMNTILASYTRHPGPPGDTTWGEFPSSFLESLEDQALGDEHSSPTDPIRIFVDESSTFSSIQPEGLAPGPLVAKRRGAGRSTALRESLDHRDGVVPDNLKFQRGDWVKLTAEARNFISRPKHPLEVYSCLSKRKAYVLLDKVTDATYCYQERNIAKCSAEEVEKHIRSTKQSWIPPLQLGQAVTVKDLQETFRVIGRRIDGFYSLCSNNQETSFTKSRQKIEVQQGAVDIATGEGHRPLEDSALHLDLDQGEDATRKQIHDTRFGGDDEAEGSSGDGALEIEVSSSFLESLGDEALGNEHSSSTNLILPPVDESSTCSPLQPKSLASDPLVSKSRGAGRSTASRESLDHWDGVFPDNLKFQRGEWVKAKLQASLGKYKGRPARPFVVFSWLPDNEYVLLDRVKDDSYIFHENDLEKCTEQDIKDHERSTKSTWTLPLQKDQIVTVKGQPQCRVIERERYGSYRLQPIGQTPYILKWRGDID